MPFTVVISRVEAWVLPQIYHCFPKEELRIKLFYTVCLKILDWWWYIEGLREFIPRQGPLQAKHFKRMGNELDQQQFTGIYTMPVTVLLNSQILQRIGEHFLAFRKCLWLLNSLANILQHYHQSNYYHNQAFPGASISNWFLASFKQGSQKVVISLYPYR